MFVVTLNDEFRNATKISFSRNVLAPSAQYIVISTKLQYNSYDMSKQLINEVHIMKVSYKKLWVMCAEREISKAELRKRAGLSSATFTKLRKNQEVTLGVMLKIAEVMQCNAGDMMDFLPDDKVIPIEEDSE